MTASTAMGGGRPVMEVITMGGGTMLARVLGVFSLGLGLYQLVAPRRFAKMIGLRPRPDREAATRAVGARELGAAAGLLSSRVPVMGMWMRVAGDVMDLALLRRAMKNRDTRDDRTGAAVASVVGITAVDLVGAALVSRKARAGGHHNGNGNGTSRPNPLTRGLGIVASAVSVDRHVVKSITIQRSRDELYSYWRDLTNLPRFMHHLESVRVDDADGRRSHWRAKAPMGMTVEWDAEMTGDAPGERISWRSVEGSQVRNAGTVSFTHALAPGATVVRVELEYDPPAGPLGVAIAKLTGEEPATQTAGDLRRFKQIMETGEVVVSDATIGGRRLRQRPARPAEPAEIPAGHPGGTSA